MFSDLTLSSFEYPQDKLIPCRQHCSNYSWCNQFQLCPEEMSPLASHFSPLFEGSAHDINWRPSQPTSSNLTDPTGPVFKSNNMGKGGEEKNNWIIKLKLLTSSFVNYGELASMCGSVKITAGCNPQMSILTLWPVLAFRRKMDI